MTLGTAVGIDGAGQRRVLRASAQPGRRIDDAGIDWNLARHEAGLAAGRARRTAHQLPLAVLRQALRHKRLHLVSDAADVLAMIAGGIAVARADILLETAPPILARRSCRIRRTRRLGCDPTRAQAEKQKAGQQRFDSHGTSSLCPRRRCEAFKVL